MRALIFDCDGVLVDSEALSCGAWLPLLARRGISANLTDMIPFIGKSDQSVLDHFSRLSGRELGSDILLELHDEYLAAARGKLRTFPGALEALNALRQHEFRLAVASSGAPAKIRFNLEQVGLIGFFEVLVSGTEVQHGKPAPDLFVLAAERLRVDAADCAVVEDSIYGLQAARSAGMSALGFTSSHSEAVLRDAGATHVFDDYAALPDLVAGLSVRIAREGRHQWPEASPTSRR